MISPEMRIKALERKVKELEDIIQSHINSMILGSDTITKNGVQILSNKTLIVPLIEDFTYAEHDHTDVSGGGSFSGSNILVNSLSGSEATSAGGTRLVFTNAGTWRGTTSKTSGTSADRMLEVTIGGATCWVPVMSAVASG